MEVLGFADARFGPVRDCFAGVVDAQPGTGAAFAAWHDGLLVVDLWGGHADLARRRLWQADSLVQPYSVSKPFAAVCALRLVETGRLELDAPVQRYWPEFRAQATVRQVLSHQAGLVALDRPVPTETAQCTGIDRVFGEESAWGLGFGVSPDGYGMGGLGGNYGGFEVAGNYAVAFVTGSAGTHDRADAIENTLRSCLNLPPLPV